MSTVSGTLTLLDCTQNGNPNADRVDRLFVNRITTIPGIAASVVADVEGAADPVNLNRDCVLGLIDWLCTIVGLEYRVPFSERAAGVELPADPRDALLRRAFELLALPPETPIGQPGTRLAVEIAGYLLESGRG